MPVFADSEKPHQGAERLRGRYRSPLQHRREALDRYRPAAGDRHLAALGLGHRVSRGSRRSPNTQIDGKQFFIPIDWGNTSILYRRDLVDIQEESWTLLWDERYKGQLSMAADGTSACRWQASSLAPRTLRHDRRRGREDQRTAGKQKPLLRFYWTATPLSSKPWPPASWSPPTAGTARWWHAGPGRADQVYEPERGSCRAIAAAWCSPRTRRISTRPVTRSTPCCSRRKPASGWRRRWARPLQQGDLRCADRRRAQGGQPAATPTVFFEKSIFQQYIPNTDVIQKMFEEVTRLYTAPTPPPLVRALTTPHPPPPKGGASPRARDPANGGKPARSTTKRDAARPPGTRCAVSGASIPSLRGLALLAPALIILLAMMVAPLLLTPIALSFATQTGLPDRPHADLGELRHAVRAGGRALPDPDL